MSDDHPEGEGPPGCVIYVFVVIALLLAPFYYAYLALRAIFHRLQGPVGFFALSALIIIVFAVVMVVRQRKH